MKRFLSANDQFWTASNESRSQMPVTLGNDDRSTISMSESDTAPIITFVGAWIIVKKISRCTDKGKAPARCTKQ